jgi:hypothetical protein
LVNTGKLLISRPSAHLREFSRTKSNSFTWTVGRPRCLAWGPRRWDCPKGNLRYENS